MDISELPAQWIWNEADRNLGGQVARFRLRFEAGRRAIWTGFADSFYTIFCNGVPLGIGPALGIFSLPRLSEWDLTPHLRVGGNVLAIEVWFEGRQPAAPDVDAYRAGLIGWLRIDDRVIPTGQAWRASTGGTYILPKPEHRGFGARRLVIADFRKDPDGWADADFDDSAWPVAKLEPHPDPARPTLRVSTIPNLTRTERRPTGLIDAGLARGGAEVQFAEDVATRMIAQTHESTLRRSHEMTVLVAHTRTLSVSGLAPAGPPSFPFLVPSGVSAEGYVALDLGLQTSGNVWLDVENADELVIDAAYADHLQLGRVNPTLQNHCFADRLIVGTGRHRVHLPTDRGFRYLQLTFSRPATLHDVWVDEHVYPNDGVVRFQSSDATLNAIWKLAEATAHQCSLWSHVDNARRERQGWGGPDIYAQMHGFFHLRGDTRLTKKMLEDFLDYFDANGFIANWCPATSVAMRWISGHDVRFPEVAWDYLLYSDDRTLAPRLLAASEAVLDYYCKQQRDGLYAKAHDEACRWIEWNMNAAQQVSTMENLLAVQSWRAVARMRGYLGVAGADEAIREADRLRGAINAKLWHPVHQALAQGTRDDGSLVDHAGQFDNAYALNNDILNPERRAAAYRFCAGASGTWPTSRSGWQGVGQGELARFDPRRPVVSGTPFASSVCARTIHARSPAEAVQYIRYNFGAMLDEGEGGLWEMWQVHQREDISSTCFCQGYGIHIAATLVQNIAGLSFLEPGGSVLEWRPLDCGVTWIEARVETRFGPVVVRSEGGQLHYRIPSGVTLRVEAAAGSTEIVGPVDI